MADPAGILPGTLDVLILKAVSLGKLHGYGVLLRIHAAGHPVLGGHTFGVVPKRTATPPRFPRRPGEPGSPRGSVGNRAPNRVRESRESAGAPASRGRPRARRDRIDPAARSRDPAEILRKSPFGEGGRTRGRAGARQPRRPGQRW